MATNAVLRLAAAAAVTACALVGGCGREEPPKAPGADDPYAERYGRLKDDEYTKALESQRDEQKEIIKRIAAIQKEIASLGDDTNSTRAVELRAALETAKKDVLKNRIRTQTIVRDGMNREDAAIRAKQEASKQKGK